MGLKERNNPLGQRNPSDRVGGDAPPQHGQSSELVEQVRAKADAIQRKVKGKPRGTNPSSPQPGEYDVTGPDRQPGRVMRQQKLGQQPRKPQQGMYTQDNEEEGPRV